MRNQPSSEIDWKTYWKVLGGIDAFVRANDSTLSDQERSVERLNAADLFVLIEEARRSGLTEKGQAIWQFIQGTKRATDKQAKALAIAVGSALFRQ